MQNCSGLSFFFYDMATNIVIDSTQSGGRPTSFRPTSRPTKLPVSSNSYVSSNNKLVSFINSVMTLPHKFSWNKSGWTINFPPRIEKYKHNKKKAIKLKHGHTGLKYLYSVKTIKTACHQMFPQISSVQVNWALRAWDTIIRNSTHHFL